MGTGHPFNPRPSLTPTPELSIKQMLSNLSQLHLLEDFDAAFDTTGEARVLDPRFIAERRARSKDAMDFQKWLKVLVPRINNAESIAFERSLQEYATPTKQQRINSHNSGTTT